jgi:hypothetical protein
MAASSSDDLGRIFISYRREETAYSAGWLFDKLVGYYGKGQIFKDVDSIQPGDDFVEVIAKAVGACDVLLALIGDHWLTITDETGGRRLDHADDFVRLEIEAALKRNVRVIPILVAEARMPKESELPKSLAKLVRRQALPLSPTRFDSDTAKLIRVLDETIIDVKAQPAVREDDSRGQQSRAREQAQQNESRAREQARQDAERAAASRQQQIEQLQRQIRDHAARHDWRAVLATNDQLAALDPAAADPDALATTAREQITRQQDAERAKTAEPDPAGSRPGGPGAPAARRRRRPVLVTAAIGVAAVVVIAIVVGAAQGHTPSSAGSHPPASPTATVTASSSPTTSTATTGLPTGYAGTWQGSLTAANGSSVNLSMTLSQGSPGTQIGTLVDETYDCDAAVYLEGGSGPVYLRLITTSNALGECVSNAYAQTLLTSSGSLQFTFEQSSAVNPSEPISDVANASGQLSNSG